MNANRFRKLRPSFQEIEMHNRQLTARASRLAAPLTGSAIHVHKRPALKRGGSRLAGALAAVGLLACAGAAHAGLTGETVHVDRLIPFINYSWNASSGQTGDLVAGVDGAYALAGGNNLSIAAGDTTISYVFGPGPGTTTPFTDSKIIFHEDALTIVGLTVTSNLTTLTNFDPARITFTAHDVSFAIGRLAWDAGDNTITATLQFADASGGGVPEPATWALLITGFGGLGAALRHRRRRTVLAA